MLQYNHGIPDSLVLPQHNPLLFPGVYVKAKSSSQAAARQGHVTQFDSSPPADLAALAAACPALPGGEEQAGILGSLPSHHTHHDLQTKLCEGQQGQVLPP